MTKEELEKVQLDLAKKIMHAALNPNQFTNHQLENLNERLDSVNRAAYYIMSIKTADSGNVHHPV